MASYRGAAGTSHTRPLDAHRQPDTRARIQPAQRYSSCAYLTPSRKPFGTFFGRVGERRPAARHVLARLAWFPPAATSIRACGSPAHGSPTFFTVGIQRRPVRLGREGRGAMTVPVSVISPIRSGEAHSMPQP